MLEVEVKGQVVQELEWKYTDGHDCLHALHAYAVGNNVNSASVQRSPGRLRCL